MDRITGRLWADVKGFERAHVIRRQELMDLLYERAIELKVPVHFNKTFSHYEEDDTGVEAFFKDGTHFRGAALLGTDGTHSPVRKQLMGPHRSTEAVPQYSWVFGSLDGDWRADLGLDRQHHPGPNKIAIGCGAGPRAMWIFGIEHTDGQQGHLEWGAVHPCGQAEGAVVGSASGADDAEQTPTGGMTSRPGLFVSVEELVKAYGDGQFGEMAHVLQKAGSGSDHGKLPAYATFFVPDAGFWSSGKHSNGGCGRVMLLGDAAHALPNVIALGATLALEDGYRVGIELAAVLNGAGGPPEAEAISEAFKLTEAKRRPRVDMIRKEAMKRQENLLSGSTYQWYMTLFAFNYILWFLNIVPPSARDEMQDSPAGASAGVQWLVCCPVTARTHLERCFAGSVVPYGQPEPPDKGAHPKRVLAHSSSLRMTRDRIAPG